MDIKRIVTAGFLTAGMLIPGAHAVSALQERPAPTVTYVVAPGDTLWRIAGDVDAVRDRRAVVDELIELNDLTSMTLLPGQTLQIPAP